MSAASTPAPRTKSPTDLKTTPTRYTLFWPLFIYFLGAGALALYQATGMEDQVNQLTDSLDKMDNQVKKADYEKTKFFSVAGDILRLSAKDPNAEQIVVKYKLRQLQNAQPELMGANSLSDVGSLTSSTSPKTADGTNAAPAKPAPTTNAPASTP